MALEQRQDYRVKLVKDRTSKLSDEYFDVFFKGHLIGSVWKSETGYSWKRSRYEAHGTTLRKRDAVLALSEAAISDYELLIECLSPTGEKTHGTLEQARQWWAEFLNNELEARMLRASEGQQ